MIKWIITSSLLIVAILILRRLFWHSIPRRLQYALWGLVLLRLLIPWNLPPGAIPPVPGVSALLGEMATAATVSGVGETAGLEEGGVSGTAAEPAGPTGDVSLSADGEGAAGMEPGQLLHGVLLLGSVTVAGVFVLTNLRLWIRFRRSRRPASVSRRGGVPVWISSGAGLPVPCTFLGGIYLTEAVDRDPVRRENVLLHEQAHLRHLDPLWAILRCVCLVLHWYNPLVWIAAGCSRTDCELACDEAVMARMQEEQRIQYGETLISLIPVRRPNRILLANAQFGEGKRAVRERISRIARQPKRSLAAVLAVAVLAGTVTACSFTGGEASSPDSQGTPDRTAVQISEGDASSGPAGEEVARKWEEAVSDPFSGPDAWLAMRDIPGIDPSRPSPRYPHMVFGADRGYNEDAVRSLLYLVEQVILEQREDGTWTTRRGYDVLYGGMETYDDWRIRWMQVSVEMTGQVEIAWLFSIEVHPTDPDQLAQTEVRSRSEDGWFSLPYVTTSPIHEMFRTNSDPWYKLALHRDLEGEGQKVASFEEYSNREVLMRQDCVIVAQTRSPYDGTGLVLPSEDT